MIKQFMEWVIIALISLAAISHLLRIVYLIFKPKAMQKIDFFSKPPNKGMLLLYYILVVGTCIYALDIKLNIF